MRFVVAEGLGHSQTEGQHSRDQPTATFWQTPNDELLTQLFTRYGVKLVLQGHMHENERITVGGVEYVESISMCGIWWKNPDVKGFERGGRWLPEGIPHRFGKWHECHSKHLSQCIAGRPEPIAQPYRSVEGPGVPGQIVVPEQSMPEGPNIEKHIAATRGTSTKCFPRWTYTTDVYGKVLGPGVHDPKASEDKKDRPINWHVGPLDYDAGWLKLQRLGADGLYAFNNPQGWVSMRRMGHIDELAERVKTGTVYGVTEGPMVEFAE